MSDESADYKIACLCELRDEQGRYLLLHRAKSPNKGLYSPIGGKLETRVGESPAQCAQREIFEEAGVTVGIEHLHLAGVISERGYHAPDGAPSTHWLMFWYRVLGPVKVECEEFDEGRLEWIEPERLMTLDLPRTDREVIWPAVLGHEGGFFSLHIDCTIEPMRWTLEQSDRKCGA
ncbi:MAG: NUDIX hydrolase [Phycisphaerales bacterium JB065]